MKGIPLRVAQMTLSLLVATTPTFATSNKTEFIKPITSSQIAKIDDAFDTAITEGGILTAGVGVIKNGKLVWSGYYGEQSPGIPASRTTQFDVASITKTVAAETVLALAEKGELSLDESMAPYWVDPDIQKDPRHKELTPRMVLNHTTGFLNWRFFSDDFTLRLMADPGSKYGYSGEGFEYLSKYAENKLGKSFETLVVDTIFKPLEIKNASFSVRKANFPNITVAKTDAGDIPGYYCRPGKRFCRKEGEFSAADDMVITVEDYAKFLISVMQGDRISHSLIKDRNRVQSDQGKNSVVDCSSSPARTCPEQQGYGLGWVVLDYGEEKLIGHGGSDWSEVAKAYFYERSQDGLIIFLNAPNMRALEAIPKLIRVIDPNSPFADQYQRWFEGQ